MSMYTDAKPSAKFQSNYKNLIHILLEHLNGSGQDYINSITNAL